MIVVDRQRCSGCGQCARICHEQCITLVGKRQIAAPDDNTFEGRGNNVVTQADRVADCDEPVALVDAAAERHLVAHYTAAACPDPTG